MNQDLVEKLKKGILLEKSDQLLLWKTPFNDLRNYGQPEYIKISSQREDCVWKKEQVLGCLNTDLTVIKWNIPFRFKHPLNYAFGFISEQEFQNSISCISDNLGQKALYKRFNKFEFRFTWKLSNCKINLRQGERYGNYWLVEIQHKSSWYGIFK